MPNQKRRTVIKILIVVPYMLVLYILQSTVFTHITLFGVKPLIIPLSVVGAALFGGRTTGGVFGIFAGMLLDMSFNQATIQFTIILTLLGIFIGILSDTVLVKGFPSFFVSSLMALIVCSICEIFPRVFFDGLALLPLIDTGIRQTLYSLIFTIPFYYLTRFLSRVI